MSLWLALVAVSIFLPLQSWCQTVQDAWTAPAAPDGSTPLKSGTKFTLLWKSGLQNNFKTYCPSCDTEKLDLWVTNFNGTKYMSKIGRGIDLTTTTSYEWTVEIASSAFSQNDFWVFRFTYFDSTDPYAQQISSPGFKINGLVKAVSTSAVQSSSIISAQTVSSSSSLAATFISAASSTSSTPQPTEQTVIPSPTSKSNVWISGVVVGPIVGIALGAALMWFCLRKRKKAQRNEENIGYGQNSHQQQYTSEQDVKEIYSHTPKNETQPWQHQREVHGQSIAEAPENASPTQPAELWHGNYRS